MQFIHSWDLLIVAAADVVVVLYLFRHYLIKKYDVFFFIFVFNLKKIVLRCV